MFEGKVLHTLEQELFVALSCCHLKSKVLGASHAERSAVQMPQRENKC